MYVDEKVTIFQAERVVENKRFEDILTSAFEGGCNYWLSLNSTDIAKEAESLDGELNIEKQLLKGGNLNCYDNLNPDEKLGVLSLVRIRAALQAMARGKDLKDKENYQLKKHFDNFVEENDDAETADVIIQIAVMGEIVFG